MNSRKARTDIDPSFEVVNGPVEQRLVLLPPKLLLCVGFFVNVNHVLWRDGGSVVSVGGKPWEVAARALCSALVGNRLCLLVVVRICMHAGVGMFTFFVEGEIYRLQWLWRRSEVVGG